VFLFSDYTSLNGIFVLKKTKILKRRLKNIEG